MLRKSSDELGVMCGEVETKDTKEKYQSSE